MVALSVPDPGLAGDRVALRPLRSDDAAAIAEACQEPDIPRYTLMPEGMTEEMAERYIELRRQQWTDGVYVFAITTPPDDRCLGQVGVGLDPRTRRADTFYWLHADVRGRGLATEALDLVTRWAFADHDVVRAQLVTHVDNAPSQRVAARAGYRREGVLRSWEPVKGDQPDVVMWSRLASDPAPGSDSP